MSECKCPECGDEYDYIELRKPLDMGLDVCPNCGVEVCEIDIPKASPGSDLAVKYGCTCPVLDNARGRGYMCIPDQFVINADCPLHREFRK